MVTPSKKPTDWNAVQAAYNAEFADTGTCSIENLAAKFKVNYGTLRNRISDKSWRPEAQALRDEVVKQTAVQAVPIIVKHRVEVMDKHLTFLAQVRQAALNQIGEAVKKQQLPLKDAIKIVFDSLRIEKLLQDMVSEGPTADMSQDEIRTNLYDDFARRMLAELEGEAKPPALS